MVRYTPIIDQASIQAAASLLDEGFDNLPGDFDRVLNRPQPAGAPNRGLLLEADGTYHGVILLIFSEQAIEGVSSVVCNISSWFIRKAYRSHAMSMLKSATRETDVIYTAYSPSETVQKMLPIFGFRKMECRKIYSIPLINLTNRASGVRIERWKNEENGKLSRFDFNALNNHNRRGFLSLRLFNENKETALVLRISKKSIKFSGIKLRFKVASVIYCKDYKLLKTAMESIHQYLMLRGVFIVDSNWPFDCDPINGKRRRSTLFVKGAESIKYIQPIYSEFSFIPQIVDGRVNLRWEDFRPRLDELALRL